MAMVVNTNVAALNATRNLERTQVGLSRAMGRLASGLRVNSAADDAAGLAISESIKAQVRGFNQAKRNAADGVSVLQTADGGLNELNGILARMKELAVQAANGVLQDADRNKLHDEFKELRSEVDRIADSVEFNGTKLLNGGLSGGMTFQVGITNASDAKITVSVTDVRAANIGSASTTARLDDAILSTAGKAQTALAIIDDAISDVTDRRGTLGAMSNRLSVTMNTLSAMAENLTAANSRIRDADVAAETASFTRGQILMQAGTSILAQANQLPQLALSLLG